VLVLFFYFLAIGFRLEYWLLSIVVAHDVLATANPMLWGCLCMMLVVESDKLIPHYALPAMHYSRTICEYVAMQDLQYE